MNSKTVFRIGGNDIMLDYLDAIGKLYESIGLDSGTIGPNSVKGILKGKYLNRGIVLHKLVWKLNCSDKTN